MKHLLLSLFAVCIALTAGVADVEAKRLGGGRSFGMNRSAPPPAAPARPAQATPQTPGQAAAAPAAAGTAARPQGRSWLGPVAGLAAGLGLAALASHLGFGDEMASLLLIALAVGVGIFILRRVFGGAAPRPGYAGGIGPGPAAGEAPAPRNYSGGGTARGALAAAAGMAAGIPDDFDVPGFERHAKLNFVRLQAANDRGDLVDIREFVSPEVFAEIKLQLDERGGAHQQTDIVQLEAKLVEMEMDGARQIASVRFSGSLREVAGGDVTDFAEIWHLVRPTDGRSGWMIAGIQQA